jgi:hypothetical protein
MRDEASDSVVVCGRPIVVISNWAGVPYKQAMTRHFDVARGKTAGDLFGEAVRFTLHTLLAVVLLLLVVFAMYLTHPDGDAAGPKMVGTVLALFVPMVAGFLIGRTRRDRTAQFVWISGVVTFAIVSVWVLGLPTGNGLCERCGAIEKLSRTFFEIHNGSGLMGGDGLLVGSWMPLAMIGYAIGAKFGVDD